MSWKFGAILLRRGREPSVEALWRDLHETRHPTGAHVSLSEATSSRFHETAVGRIGDVSLVHDNLMPYDCSFEDEQMWAFDETLAAASRQGDVLAVLVDGVSGTYGFSLFSGGARVRRRGVVPGSGTIDEGTPLEGEQENADEESRAFSVLSAFLGTPFFRALQDRSLRLAVYERPEDEP